MAVAWLLRPFILSLSALLAFSNFSHSINESEALLKFKKSLRDASSLGSWVPNTSPCHGNPAWEGLICHGGHVLGLQIEKMGLSGNIDISALAELSGLRSVSIMNNSFTGTIPEFNRLGALKALYLSGNQFSGEIPQDFFSKMDSMKKVWLSGNMFTGPIPSSLAALTNLIELRLENNQFIGPIPRFEQPTLLDINLSNNKLEGEIPPGLYKFGASSFAGNPGLCGGKSGKECDKAIDASPPIGNSGGLNDSSVQSQPQPQPQPHRKKDGPKKYIAAFVTLGVMLLSVIVFLIIKWRRKKEKKKEFGVLRNDNAHPEEAAVEVQVSVPTKKEPAELSKKGGGLSRKGSHPGKGTGSNGGMAELVVVNDERGVFGLPDLMKAAAEVLGNGGLGSSYKAVMANGVAVVVKRIRGMNALGRDGFDAEIRRLARIQHRNILTPLGYHFRKDEKLLVTEYIPKGSLLYLLHGDHGQSHAELAWPARLKIVQGIARGLSHLHIELAALDLPHGNLKSSNVLLRPDNEPLLSDYGFKPLINPNNAAPSLFAYKAPEAAQYGLVSPKCDVYCLGVIILEILTGKFPSQYLSNTKGGTDVVEWVASAVAEGRGAELLDPEIASSRDSLGQMEQLLHIGVACTEINPQQRLDMKEAIRSIVDIQLEDGGRARAIELLPSLKDGYADASHTNLSNSQLYTNQPAVRHRPDGSEDRSRHPDGDGFAFGFS